MNMEAFRSVTRNQHCWVAVGVICAVSGGLALIASAGASAANHPPRVNPTASRPPSVRPHHHDLGAGGLATITEVQLQAVGVTLAPPTSSSVPITADQAAEAAHAQFEEPVVEEALDQCTQGSIVDQPCWAVSLAPPLGAASASWGGPAIRYSSGNSNARWTFELVLVDAETGTVITGIVSAVPPNSPSS